MDGQQENVLPIHGLFCFWYEVCICRPEGRKRQLEVFAEENRVSISKHV